MQVNGFPAWDGAFLEDVKDSPRIVQEWLAKPEWDGWRVLVLYDAGFDPVWGPMVLRVPVHPGTLDNPSMLDQLRAIADEARDACAAGITERGWG